MLSIRAAPHQVQILTVNSADAHPLNMKGGFTRMLFTEAATNYGSLSILILQMKYEDVPQQQKRMQ